LQLSVNSSGNGMALWANTGTAFNCSGGDNPGLWASHFDAASRTWRPGVQVWQVAAWWQGAADLQLLSAGADSVATWTVRNPLSAKPEDHVWTARFDAANKRWSAPTVLAPVKAQTRVVRADSAGNVQAVWNQGADSAAGGAWTVRANRYDAARKAWAPSAITLSQTLDWRALESLHLDVASNGNAAVVWGEARGIWASRWQCR